MKELAVAVVFVAFALGLRAETSESAFLFANPAQTRLWNTVVGGDVELPVVYPPGAGSASVTVTAPGYSQVYSDITGANVVIRLPEAETLAAETVYELTLAFDDEGDETDQHARLAVISGYSAGSSGLTRCRVPSVGVRWGRVTGNSAVVPVPAEATSLSVDDKTIVFDPPSASWHQVTGVLADDIALSLELPEGAVVVTLSETPGFLLLFR